MKPSILVSDPIHERALSIMEEGGLEVDYRPQLSLEELGLIIPNYDALIVRGRTRVTAELMAKAKRLKLIGRPGVGLDNIDLEAASKAGIVVINTPEALTNSVAELVMGLMVALARDLARANESIKEGRWIKNELMGLELRGKTLGIVGLGRIGRRVGELARAFGMELLAYDIVEIPQDVVRGLGVKMVGLEELLSNSDFITLHIPLTNETRRMFDYQLLRKVKRGAYLINASRGGVIDEEALLRALKEGLLAGAALDVFEEEPIRPKELYALPNVLCTPHIGAQTKEAQEEAGRMLAEKVVRWFKSGKA